MAIGLPVSFDVPFVPHKRSRRFSTRGRYPPVQMFCASEFLFGSRLCKNALAEA